MRYSAEEAFNDIKNYMDQKGYPYSYWYCGTCNFPRENEIRRQCESYEDARLAMEALMALGCDGDGGEKDTEYVYAYLEEYRLKADGY